MVPLHEGSKFNNPLYVELMGKHFNLKHNESFLGKRVIMEHDYYDYIQDEQNRIWAFQMCVALSSHLLIIRVKDGIAFSRQGNAKKAYECYDSAIEVDPTNVEAFVAKGALQCQLEYGVAMHSFSLFICRNYEDAMKSFNIALKYDSMHANATKYLQIAIAKVSVSVSIGG